MSASGVGGGGMQIQPAQPQGARYEISTTGKHPQLVRVDANGQKEGYEVKVGGQITTNLDVLEKAMKVMNKQLAHVQLSQGQTLNIRFGQDQGQHKVDYFIHDKITNTVMPTTTVVLGKHDEKQEKHFLALMNSVNLLARRVLPGAAALPATPPHAASHREPMVEIEGLDMEPLPAHTRSRAGSTVEEYEDSSEGDDTELLPDEIERRKGTVRPASDDYIPM